MNSDDELDGAIYAHIKDLLESTSEEENVEKPSSGGSLPGNAANFNRENMEADARMRRQDWAIFIFFMCM